MTVTRAEQGMKAALLGLFVNICMVAVKLVAGIAGHSYALIADAIESSTDLFSSLIVWGGIWVTTRPPDEDYPYGYGKAETLAGAIVALMLLGAALGIGVAAVGELIAPHDPPAPFTLLVLVLVIVTKEMLFRTVLHVGQETESTAVKADAWHHRSDAVTSAAAFVGIGLAIWGGKKWAVADEWAAIVAAVIIGFNGLRLLRPAVRELMDHTPEGPILARVTATAQSVEGVRAIEKIYIRKQGMDYFVDMHVHADQHMSLHDAHVLSGRVKGAIRAAHPHVKSVLIHMEPYEQHKEEGPGAEGV